MFIRFRRYLRAIAQITIIILLCTGATFSSFAQTKAIVSKDDKIKDIMMRTHELDTVRRTFELLMPTIIDAYRKKNPNITAAQTDEMLKVIRSTLGDLEPSFENMLVQNYKDQLNDEQIDALYEFYSTTIGQQIAEKQQSLSSAAYLLGKTWGETIFVPEITKRFQSDDLLKGLDLK